MAAPTRSAARHIRLLRPRALLVLYTDGLVEAEHDMLGGLAVLTLKVDYLGATDAEKLQRPWHIDVADGRNGQALRLAVIRYLRELAAETSGFFEAELILGELLANVAQHTPGDARVDIAWRDDSAYLVVEDHGPPIVRREAAARADRARKPDQRHATRDEGHPDNVLAADVSGRDLNDPTSQFAYRLARGKDVNHAPGPGCGCMLPVLVVIGIAVIALISMIR